jgi:hypothetical protein
MSPATFTFLLHIPGTPAPQATQLLVQPSYAVSRPRPP